MHKSQEKPKVNVGQKEKPKHGPEPMKKPGMPSMNPTPGGSGPAKGPGQPPKR